ncbi:rho gtpase activation protein [Anaeramoeba flamelloides]|uniref:Rho gtpase activation protein n=1 Tax=Anaeramoeba flamelloides TaxID=1746091 RepID=A0AAV7Y8X7_9EUKA|nr:rho gtpase activation protein [Anaeramoeba flamelloides]
MKLYVYEKTFERVWEKPIDPKSDNDLQDLLAIDMNDLPPPLDDDLPLPDMDSDELPPLDDELPLPDMDDLPPMGDEKKKKKTKSKKKKKKKKKGKKKKSEDLPLPDMDTNDLPPPLDDDLPLPDMDSDDLPPPLDDEMPLPDMDSDDLPPPLDDEMPLPDMDSDDLPPPLDDEMPLPDMDSDELPPPLDDEMPLPDMDDLPPMEEKKKGKGKKKEKGKKKGKEKKKGKKKENKKKKEKEKTKSRRRGGNKNKNKKKESESEPETSSSEDDEEVKLTYPPCFGFPEVSKKYLSQKVSKLKLSNWAEKYFSVQKSGGTLRKKKISCEDLLSYSIELKKPLLQSVAKSKVSDKALENFKDILEYIGAKKGVRAGDYQVLIRILERGIKNKELRSEIYLQTCKQMNGKVPHIQKNKVWEIFTLISTTFAPDKMLFDPLKYFIVGFFKNKNNNIRHFAMYSFIKFHALIETTLEPKLPSERIIRAAAVLPFQSVLIFGASLPEISWYQKDEKKNLKIPECVIYLCEQIKKTGLGSVGIFRIPGDSQEVERMKQQMNSGDFEIKLKNPTIPASALKLFLRELFEPIFPVKVYNDCLKHTGKIDQELEIVKSLPPINLHLLAYIVKFLKDISVEEIAQKTKMGDQNLSMVFAPNLFRPPPDLDQKNSAFNQPREQLFLLTLIKKWDTSPYLD